VRFPSGLQSLTLLGLEEKLDGLLLPDSLPTLAFGDSVNQSLAHATLPCKYVYFSVCRLRPEATAPQPLPPAAAPNTGQCPIDYKYVDSQTITVKLKGESALAAAAAPAGIITFCPTSSDTFIIERKSSLQSCMHKRKYTSNAVALACYT